MPDTQVLLYFDEDVSVVLASILRARGFDVLTTRDAENRGQSDIGQLTFSAKNHRALLTHNRLDFEALHGKFVEEGKPHEGIILARRRPPGEMAARIGRLLTKLGPTGIRDQLLYV